MRWPPLFRPTGDNFDLVVRIVFSRCSDGYAVIVDHGIACGQTVFVQRNFIADFHAVFVHHSIACFEGIGIHGLHANLVSQLQLSTTGNGFADDVAVTFDIDGVAQCVVVAAGGTAEVDAFGDVGALLATFWLVANSWLPLTASLLLALRSPSATWSLCCLRHRYRTWSG